MKFDRQREDRKRSGRTGISLQRFAGAKKNRYDKKARLEKAAKLNAKRLNKYRKLTAKLEGEGRLKPVVSKRTRESDEEDKEVKRARSRAGPPPGEALSDDSNDEVGASSQGESDGSSGEDSGDEDRAEVDGSEADGMVKAQPASKGQHNDGGQPGTSKPGKGSKQKPWKPPSQVELLAEKVAAEKDAKRAARERKAVEAMERQKKVAVVEKRRKKEKGLFLKKTKRGQPVMKHRIDKILGQLQA